MKKLPLAQFMQQKYVKPSLFYEMSTSGPYVVIWQPDMRRHQHGIDTFMNICCTLFEKNSRHDVTRLCPLCTKEHELTLMEARAKEQLCEGESVRLSGAAEPEHGDSQPICRTCLCFSIREAMQPMRLKPWEANLDQDGLS